MSLPEGSVHFFTCLVGLWWAHLRLILETSSEQPLFLSRFRVSVVRCHPSSRLAGRGFGNNCGWSLHRPGKRDGAAGVWGRIRATNKKSFLNSQWSRYTVSGKERCVGASRCECGRGACKKEPEERRWFASPACGKGPVCHHKK